MISATSKFARVRLTETLVTRLRTQVVRETLDCFSEKMSCRHSAD